MFGIYIIQMRTKKLTDEERIENRKKSYLKYRRTEKGRQDIRKASLRYYHRNKHNKTNNVKTVDNEDTTKKNPKEINSLSSKS